MTLFTEAGAWGAAIGAAATLLVGFTWGGWVTQATASSMARESADGAVLAALVPICVAQSQRDPGAKEKLDQLTQASSWSRGDLLEKTGWATVPGTDSPNRVLAAACLKKLAVSP